MIRIFGYFIITIILFQALAYYYKRERGELYLIIVDLIIFSGHIRKEDIRHKHSLQWSPPPSCLLKGKSLRKASVTPIYMLSV